MFFKNFKNKLLLLFVSIFILPLTTFAYSKQVILGGNNIGIEVHTNGVLIVGFYDIDGTSPGKNANLKIGDTIIQIEDKAISKIDDLSKVIGNDSLSLNITYRRKNKTYTTTLQLVKDQAGVFKTGLYVKDSITGIGTLTFIDPETNKFGALGHEISEKSTGQKFEVASGSIYSSKVTSIDKSTRNDPGGKNAIFDVTDEIGSIFKNEKNGIYGTFTKDYDSSKRIDVAENHEVTLGEAEIYTVIEGTKKEKFTIEILNIDTSHSTKNILFQVTDQRLLSKTNGIVQGMSGSPIVQNNKIIGAVTHVVVDNPEKGYGILISNMLEEANKKE